MQVRVRTVIHFDAVSFMICFVESPGKPAAHKSAYLPLLPSGPDGVHKILLHRARTLHKRDHPFRLSHFAR